MVCISDLTPGKILKEQLLYDLKKRQRAVKQVESLINFSQNLPVYYATDFVL